MGRVDPCSDRCLVTLLYILNLKCPLTPLENHLRKAAGEGYDKRSPRQGEIAIGMLFGGVAFAMHAVNFAKYRDAIAGLFG